MSGAALTLAAVLALAGRPECGGSQGVEPARLAAIAQAESGFRPLAINVNGGPQVAQPATAEEAARVATALITSGKSVDLGLMQINSTQLARHNLTVAAAFDACASMAAGAAHIAADLRAAWTAAHQRYNSGSLTGAPAYAQRISAAMAQIAARPAQPAPAAPPSPPAERADPFTQSVGARELTYSRKSRTAQ